MLEFLRSPSRSAAGAILYVTVGTLMVIWAGLWYVYFIVPQEHAPPWQQYTCVSTVLSGFAIVAIGLLYGLIGHGAKSADNTVGVAPAGPLTPVIASGTAIPANMVGTTIAPTVAMNDIPATPTERRELSEIGHGR